MDPKNSKIRLILIKIINLIYVEKYTLEYYSEKMYF